MKKTAKLLAVLLAVLLGMTAMASLVAYADFTIPPDEGTLTIHKYLMPDLALAGDPNDGNELSGQALDDLNELISDGKASPLNGIVFKIYLIDFPSDTPGNPNPDNAPLKTLFQNGGFTMSPSYTGVTKITSAGVDYDVTLVDTQTTANDGTDDGIAFFDNLEKGYYLVVEQPSDKVTSIANPFVVAVPMTNADSDGWIQDVHCYPKNGDMSVTKEANTHAAYLGEIVDWTVELSIPADIEDYQLYYMTDVFDAALTYIYGSLEVYGIDDTGTATLIPVANASGPDNYRETMNGATNTLKVDFIAAAVTGPPALAEADGRETLSDYKFVRFTFSTYINETILDRDQQPEYTLVNDSKITFANQFDDVSEPRERETTEEVEVHAAAIIFNKLNAHTGAELEGAGFQIATSDANARAGKFLKLLVDTSDDTIIAILDDPTGTAGNAYSSSYTDTNGTNTDADDVIYNYDGTKDGTGTPKSTWAVQTWEEFSAMAVAGDYVGDTATWDIVDGKSIVRFEGLKQYTGTVDDPGSYLPYYVVETTAPTGFNLLLDPIQIDFDESVTSTNWFTLSFGTVNNTNTFTLPRTGGIGTILFTAGGIALIGVAAVLLVLGAKKKKKVGAAA